MLWYTSKILSQSKTFRLHNFIRVHKSLNNHHLNNIKMILTLVVHHKSNLNNKVKTALILVHHKLKNSLVKTVLISEDHLKSNLNLLILVLQSNHKMRILLQVLWLPKISKNLLILLILVVVPAFLHLHNHLSNNLDNHLLYNQISNSNSSSNPNHRCNLSNPKCQHPISSNLTKLMLKSKNISKKSYNKDIKSKSKWINKLRISKRLISYKTKLLKNKNNIRLKCQPKFRNCRIRIITIMMVDLGMLITTMTIISKVMIKINMIMGQMRLLTTCLAQTQTSSK